MAVLRPYVSLMFNETEGGDPMSNEMSVLAMDFGKVMVAARQPSA